MCGLTGGGSQGSIIRVPSGWSGGRLIFLPASVPWSTLLPMAGRLSADAARAAAHPRRPRPLSGSPPRSLFLLILLVQSSRGAIAFPSRSSHALAISNVSRQARPLHAHSL